MHGERAPPHAYTGNDEACTPRVAATEGLLCMFGIREADHDSQLVVYSLCTTSTFRRHQMVGLQSCTYLRTRTHHYTIIHPDILDDV
jgi:hypothetical protein